MYPFLGETNGLPENINVLNRLYDTGRTTIILTTSRPDKYKQVTEEQLQKEGLKYHKLVMGSPHAKRVIVNDFATSNPYPSCEAINLPRNADHLKEFVDG